MQELDEAKDKAIACKEDRTGGGFPPIVSTGNNTATATGTITNIYGCLIPLGLLNRAPPITEPCMVWERRPEKIYGGHSRESKKTKCWCRKMRRRRRSVIPAIAMVRPLGETIAKH